MWDMGKWNNIKQVIGNNYLGILIPWTPTHLKEGLEFPVNPAFESK